MLLLIDENVPASVAALFAERGHDVQFVRDPGKWREVHVESSNVIFNFMRHFTASVDIAAPAQRVWQVMADVDRWHEWTAPISSITRIGGAPLGVGTRVVIRQPKFPPALWKVNALEPGRSFTWTSAGPGFRAVGTHSVEATASGSRATLSLSLEGPLGGLFGRITSGITERYVNLEAQGLKSRAEQHGTLR